MTTRVLLLTCEHGGSTVPPAYRRLFRSNVARSALQSHRGLDLGAIDVARFLARRLQAPLFASTTTRLLVDLNRSIGHPRLFSEFSRSLDAEARATLLDRHYFPHRDAVASVIDAEVNGGRQVLHVGVHSFVPRLDGKLRTADVGLLYDPKRRRERALCARWKRELEAVDPELRIRRNYPYVGSADGLVTYFRKRFGAARYVGIELECNQALLGQSSRKRKTMTSIERSLRRMAHA